MDTTDFLKAILPEDGVKFVARWVAVPDHQRGGFFTHEPFVELDAMADCIAGHVKRNNTVYHACATFKEVIYMTAKNGKEFPAGRTKDNALMARTFWIDFDVKPGVASAYESKNAVVSDVKRLVRDVGLPTPLLVNSGNGIHAYFLMEENILRNEWEDTAWMLRSVLDHLGVKHDVSRTCDIASILRPAGSVNLKNPENPKQVAVLNVAKRASHQSFRDTLQRFIDSNNVGMSARRAPALPFTSDLITKVEYPDSFAAVIKEHCNQVKLFSENGGADQTSWYYTLGVLNFCVDGEQYAHEWGAQYDGYSADSTNDQLDRWKDKSGPPSCATLREKNPSGCEGCTKTCKTPLQLGYKLPENVPHTPLVVENVVEETEVVEAGPGSKFWPSEYRVANGRVEIAAEQEDGTIRFNPLLGCPVWLLREIRAENSEFLLHMRAEIRAGKYHDFDIPSSCLSSPDKLKSALAANRVHVLSHSTKAGIDIMNLIIKQTTAMQQLCDEINTFDQLGWNANKDAFLLGDSLITAGGHSTVRVAGSIINLNKGKQSLQGAYTTSGTISEYHDGVMHLYGAPGYEAMQYVLAASLGAYLSPFVSSDMWHGIPLAVYSSKSGFGKTTGVAIGLNAICNHKCSMSSDGTLMAMKTMLGLFGSMPVFYDELTQKFDAEPMKDLVYNWSLGMDRIRVTRGGTIRERGNMWNNMGFITTNESILAKLNDAPNDPEAAQYRVIEIDVAEYLPHKPLKPDQKLANHLVDNVYGVATKDFFRRVITNREKIIAAIDAEFHSLTDNLPDAYATSARYYCRHASCAIVGAKVGKQLGLWSFDVAAIRAFIVRHIKRQVDKIQAYRVSPEDRFAAMMADLSPRMLVTYRFDTLDGRRKNTVEATLTPIPRDGVVGRYAIGCPATATEPVDPGRLYVAVSAVNDWCKKRGISANELRAEWLSSGLVEVSRGASANGETRVSLSKGVPTVSLPQARCVEFVVSKVREAIPGVDIRAVSGTTREAVAV